MNTIFSDLLENVDRLDENFRSLIDAKGEISLECKRLQQVANENQLREKTFYLETKRVQVEEHRLQLYEKQQDKKIFAIKDEYESKLRKKEECLEDVQRKEANARTLDEQRLQLYEKQHAKKISEMRVEYESRILKIEQCLEDARRKEVNVRTLTEQRLQLCEKEHAKKIAEMKDEYDYKLRNLEQCLEDKRKTEANVRASVECQKRNAALEVRNQYEGKLKRLEKELQSYRERDKAQVDVSANLSTNSAEKKRLRVSFNDELNETSYFNNFSDDEMCLADNDNLRMMSKESAGKKCLAEENIKEKETHHQETEYQLPDIDNEHKSGYLRDKNYFVLNNSNVLQAEFSRDKKTTSKKGIPTIDFLDGFQFNCNSNIKDASIDLNKNEKITTGKKTAKASTPTKMFDFLNQNVNEGINRSIRSPKFL